MLFLLNSAAVEHEIHFCIYFYPDVNIQLKADNTQELEQRCTAVWEGKSELALLQTVWNYCNK